MPRRHRLTGSGPSGRAAAANAAMRVHLCPTHPCGMAQSKTHGRRGESPLIGEQHNYGVNNGKDVASAMWRQTYNSYSAGRTR
jgi:hypothetical protein